MVKVKGVTLVELMVTIAVAAILLVIGAPSLNNLYQSIRADMAIRKIHQAVTYARGQAVTLGQNVTVCHLSEGSCTKDWQQGVTIFVDQDSDAIFDDIDMNLNHIGAFNEKDTISINNDSNGIVFQNDGKPNDARSIIYCTEHPEHVAPKKVVISNSGRVKVEEGESSDCPSSSP